MRRRLARWADLVFGPRCPRCCERVFAKDARSHEAVNHAGDWPWAP